MSCDRNFVAPIQCSQNWTLVTAIATTARFPLEQEELPLTMIPAVEDKLLNTECDITDTLDSRQNIAGYVRERLRPYVADRQIH